jgi:CRISPR-associated protein Csx16
LQQRLDGAEAEGERDMKSIWNDKMGSRSRHARAVLVTEDGTIYNFVGDSIKDVCASTVVGGRKDGKWSYSEYEILHRPTTSFVSWMDDWESGRAWPQRSWAEGMAWLQRFAPQVTAESFERFIRSDYPRVAERWDEYARNEAEFGGEPLPPVIVSRHAGAIEWLRQRGIQGEVIAQVTSPEQVRGRVVVGALPLHLAAEAAEVVAIDMPRLSAEQRGRDLSPAEMDAAGAALSRYVVRRLG